MALTDANPAFGPTEQGKMLERGELDRFGAIWIDSDTFEKIELLTLENQSFRPQNSKTRKLKIRDFEGSKNGPETS